MERYYLVEMSGSRFVEGETETPATSTATSGRGDAGAPLPPLGPGCVTSGGRTDGRTEHTYINEGMNEKMS